MTQPIVCPKCGSIEIHINAFDSTIMRIEDYFMYGCQNCYWQFNIEDKEEGDDPSKDNS